jgi:hypothetical protein
MAVPSEPGRNAAALVFDERPLRAMSGHSITDHCANSLSPPFAALYLSTLNCLWQFEGLSVRRGPANRFAPTPGVPITMRMTPTGHCAEPQTGLPHLLKVRTPRSDRAILEQAPSRREFGFGGPQFIAALGGMAACGAGCPAAHRLAFDPLRRLGLRARDFAAIPSSVVCASVRQQWVAAHLLSDHRFRVLRALFP